MQKWEYLFVFSSFSGNDGEFRRHLFTMRSLRIGKRGLPCMSTLISLYHGWKRLVDLAQSQFKKEEAIEFTSHDLRHLRVTHTATKIRKDAKGDTSVEAASLDGFRHPMGWRSPETMQIYIKTINKRQAIKPVLDDEEEQVLYGILLTQYRSMPTGAFCTLSAHEGAQIDMSDLYSVLFELRVRHAATISGTTGYLAHALFLNLIKQFDPALSASLHNLSGPKPFTVSPLLGVEQQAENLTLPREQICSLRITLLDGGDLWHHLSTYALQTEVVQVHLGPAALRLTRFITSTSADLTGWADTTDWLTLAGLPAQRVITMQFTSPTAFNLGDRAFELFPKPSFIWESLRRVWNAYAPQHLKMDKQRLRMFLKEHVSVLDCDIATMMWRFPQYVQKGFVGTCTYQIQEEDSGIAANLTTLAAFARYAGIGYKTTMGMGQARALLLEHPPTIEIYV